MHVHYEMTASLDGLCLHPFTAAGCLCNLFALLYSDLEVVGKRLEACWLGPSYYMLLTSTAWQTGSIE
jgi:hypothetical protein